MSWLLRTQDRSIRITGARERRKEAWSLRAANVARDKKTGRFISRTVTRRRRSR